MSITGQCAAGMGMDEETGTFLERVDVCSGSIAAFSSFTSAREIWPNFSSSDKLSAWEC